MADSPANRRLRRHQDDDVSNDETVDATMVPSDTPSAPESGMSRAIAICEGRKLIQETQQRLKQLERDHARHVERASLLVDAERGWGYMGYRERRNPANILLALQSPKRPSCMKWENFDHHFSQGIRQDKEILLARLNCVPGFEEYYRGRVIDVPRILRGDKEVMMEFCKRDGNTLKHASKALKEDRELVMTAIAQNPCALMHASPKLKGDRRMARAVLGRPNGIKAFSMLCRKLQEDPKLAILAIRKSGEEYMECHFEDLPDHFVEDEDVVLEAVRHRGRNLRYVTEKSFLSDLDIVYQACSNDGTALEFVPKGSTRECMLKGNNLMTVLSHGGGRFLGEAPPAFRQDPEFVLAAVENGYTHASLANYYKSDKDFFFELIAKSNNIDDLYDCLTEELRNQKDVVLALLKNESISAARIRSIVHRHDFLLRDEAIVMDVVRRGCLSALGRKTVQDLMKEKAFVLKACAIDGACLQYASKDLQKDVDCIMAAFLNSEEPISIDTMVHSLPDEIWRDDDIVERIIRMSDKDLSDEYTLKLLRDHIPDLRTRNVYLACLEAGWPTKSLPYSARSTYEDDEEVVLAMLKHQKERGGGNFYHQIGPSLRTNRSFLERAIAVDPCVLSFAKDTLRFDYDLMLQAVGACRSALLATAHTASMTKLVEFATRVRERKAVGDAFVLEFLRGIAQGGPKMSVSPPPRKRQRKGKIVTTRRQKKEAASGCHLPLLNCGAETGVALKRLIGDFVGIPLGREYKLLKSASDNLEFWGY